MPHRILICEDDLTFAANLRALLELHGHRVTLCPDGASALGRLTDEDFSLLILDLMLPDMDGFDVCRRMRRASRIPVIMISGRRGETDRIIGLEVGADDYLPKPFSARVLMARIEAQLRRASDYARCDGPSPIIDLGGLQLDKSRHEVVRHGRPVHLTPKEFDLLSVLAENRGSVVRSAHLLLRVWGYDSDIRTRTLDVHMGRLRAKLEPNPQRPQYLITVPGVGYKLCAVEPLAEAA